MADNHVMEVSDKNKARGAAIVKTDVQTSVFRSTQSNKRPQNLYHFKIRETEVYTEQ